MDEYTELRTLLLQQEQLRIQALEQRIEDLQQRSQDVAAILPDALQRAPDFSELVTALQNPVDHCVKTTVKADPNSFAEPLLPVMTPAIQQPLLDRYQQLAELEQDNVSALQQRLKVLEDALEHFKELEAQLNDAENRVKELANFLPKAIREASDEQPAETNTPDDEAELTDSLKRPVQRCLRQSISEDTQDFADTLFPVMGPAIRRSINESLKAFVQEVNTRLEQSPMSPQGLGWWVESKRKGIPVHELILRDTLVYRIEEVFLIHNESGLLIHHLHQTDIEVGDSDAVSAMFTAIQDFIRDSFSSTREASLDKVEIGEHMVWLERGPYAVLACVIRGTPPYEYKTLMSQVMETLHARYGKRLEQFDGDNTHLQPCLPLLQKTLQLERKEKEQKKSTPKAFAIAASVLLLLGIGWLAWWQYDAYLQRDIQTRINAYLTALQQTPGIVPVSHAYAAGKLILQGLRDPLAIAPASLSERQRLTDIQIQETWTPYQDLTPKFTQQRLQHSLAPPATVEMQLTDNILHLKGHADTLWIDNALQKVQQVTAVEEVVTRDLVDSAAYWQQTASTFKQLVQRLDDTAGLVVIASGVDNDQYFIRGLRDPLATEPETVVANTAFTDLHSVAMHWQPYQDLSPALVEQRALAWLQPPATVDMQLEERTLTVTGNASTAWIAHLQDSLGKISGVTALNTEQLLDNELYWTQTQPLFDELLQALRDTIGITVVESGIADAHYYIHGLRDPLAPDPQTLIQQYPQLHEIKTHWQAYKDLAPALVKQRAIRWLQPPDSVQISLHGVTLKLSGSANDAWIQQAQQSLGKLAGIEALDVSELQNDDVYWLDTAEQFADFIDSLKSATGLTVVEYGKRNDRYYVQGLQDPLAPEPSQLLALYPDLQPVEMQWQRYQDLASALVRRRAIAWLQPPDSVQINLQGATLKLSGNASDAWIQTAQQSLGKLAGITALDVSELQNNDAYWLDTAAQFADLITSLNSTTGLTVIEHGIRDDSYYVRGLKDPLAPEPSQILALYPDLQTVQMQWQGYQDLAPALVRERAIAWLQPPDSVQVNLQGETLQLSGTASDEWIQTAQHSLGKIAGVTALDVSGLHNSDAEFLASRPAFNAFVEQLNATAGLTVVETAASDHQYFIYGLRDPLATDPQTLLEASGLSTVTMRWQPYQDLSPAFILQRAQAALQPPASVTLTVENDTLKLTGNAPQQWIVNALQNAPQIAGIAQLDRSELVNEDVYWQATEAQFNALVNQLNETAGLLVVDHGIANQQYFIKGLRDPFALDPATVIAESGLDNVDSHWQAYQDLAPEFVAQRLLAWLDPPDTVQVDLQADKLVLSGQASKAWLEKAHGLNPVALQVDAQAVQDQDQMLRQRLISDIEKIQIFFSEDVTLRDGQTAKFKQLAAQIKQLAALNAGGRYPLKIEVTGNTDGLGTRLQNQQLGLQRALAMRELLHKTYGVERHNILVMPPLRIRSGARAPNFNLRYVALRVNL